MNIIDIYRDYNKILIVGPYPPPLGGISVFIYRLKKILKDQNLNIEIFNTSRDYHIIGLKYFLFCFKIIFNNYQLIHVHHFDLKKIFLLYLMRYIKGFKIFHTSHGTALTDNKNKLVRLAYKKLIRKLDLLIVVNDYILDLYEKEGFVLPKKYIIQNAFLPPSIDEEDMILQSYPENIFDFIENHKPILISNAFQLIFINNVDLYGLDLYVELVKKLKIHFPQIGFIFALANANNNKSYFQKIKLEIENNSLNENFYFLTGQKEIWPLFKRSDLFIRATYKDGYGISIDESIYFNCTALASDVCKRHPSAILFENRNLDDLFMKSLSILKTKNK